MKLEVYFPSPEEIEGWHKKENSKPPPSYFAKETAWLNKLFEVRFLIMQRCSERLHNIIYSVDDKKIAIALSFELEKLGYSISIRKVNQNKYHLHISWQLNFDEDEDEELGEEHLAY